jgi:hypothetical protein
MPDFTHLLNSLYPLWILTWVLVALHYGSAAWQSWRVKHRVLFIVLDLSAPFWWALKDAVTRISCVLRGIPQPETPRYVPLEIDGGAYLRAAIFLASLSPAVVGFLYYTYPVMISPDRAFIGCINLLVSISAGLCHLFLALRARPSGWQLLVLMTIGWLVGSYIASVY